MGKTEQVYLFASPEHGLPKEGEPGLFLQTFYRYGIALSYATELKKRDAYLDYGSGSGWGCELLGNFFEKAVGFDRDARALSYSSKLHSRSGVVYTGDKAAITAVSPTFDMITFYECIEHMPVEEAKTTLKHIASLLHEDGMLIVTTPIALTNDGSNESNPYHVHEYHPGELKMMLLEHFKDVKMGNTITGQMAMCGGPKR